MAKDCVTPWVRWLVGNTDRPSNSQSVKWIKRRSFLSNCMWCCAGGRVWPGNLVLYINRVDNVIWPPKRVSKLTFGALALLHSEELTLEISALKLFTVAELRYQLSWSVIPNYPVIQSFRQLAIQISLGVSRLVRSSTFNPCQPRKWSVNFSYRI